jgi:two-component system, OmpR family, phosphate regulon response regulator PhoB
MITTTPQVLIVDDDPDIRELLAFSFGRAGFEIHTAADGQDALEVVAEHDPALVILDWMMPRMDGIEFCLRLRADEAHSTLPVIFLSARTSELDILMGTIAGAADFVTKPFSPHALVRRALNALAGVPRGDSVGPPVVGGVIA